MKSLSVLLVVAVLAAVFSSMAVAIEYHSGDVWGTWTKANSPHIITGVVRVPPESTLVIEPGCEVLFRGYYHIIVDTSAILLAIGTQSDSVLFAAETPGTNWHGIRFRGADSASAVAYCRFQDGNATGGGTGDYGGAAYCSSSNPSITSCTFEANHADRGGGAVYCTRSGPSIIDNSFIGNSSQGDGGAICCDSSSDPSIAGNRFSSNMVPRRGGFLGYGGAVACRVSSNPTITENTFSDNEAEWGGGLACLTSSDPMVSRNTFTSNTASSSGGAICCFYAGPVLTANNFTSNHCIFLEAWRLRIELRNSYDRTPDPENPSPGGKFSGEGGAIYCEYADAVVEGNAFTSNWSNWSGGAIACVLYSSARIVGNTFTDNWSGGEVGGAIDCYFSDPIISGNAFLGNHGLEFGGAIFCHASSSLITGNTFVGNSVSYPSGAGGGAIAVSYSDLTISNNAFTRNRSTFTGGAIYSLNGSNPSVQNSILWEDEAPDDPEIAVDGASAAVAYCDIEGGYVGAGNIDADPLFVNSDSGNVHLHWGSPCIDAGNPVSPLDPDSTGADMGAFYFNQSVTPSVEVYPQHLPIIIPPEGGGFSFDTWVYNLSDTLTTMDLWFYAFLPGGKPYGPFCRRNGFTLHPDGMKGENNLRQQVPATAPAGDYRYVGYVGRFRKTVLDSSCFTFTKTR